MHRFITRPGQSGVGAMKLSEQDRINVQLLHGVCKGSFSTVLDWLDVKYDGDPEFTAPTYMYNTYFFRRGHFWKYENRYNRTLPDHPKPLYEQWPGLPSEIDTIVQIPYRCTDGLMVVDIKTYIFKGEQLATVFLIYCISLYQSLYPCISRCLSGAIQVQIARSVVLYLDPCPHLS